MTSRFTKENRLALAYRDEHAGHWDETAKRPRRAGGAYHRRLGVVYRFLVPTGSRVLELGCGNGDLLAALAPTRGVGVDFSAAMIEAARARHPALSFVHADVHEVAIEGDFDFVILSDLVNDVYDVQTVLRRAHAHCGPQTRLIINFHSRLWQPLLNLARFLGLARPNLAQNWLEPRDLRNLLYLSGFETIRHIRDCLLPLPVPLLNGLLNRVVAKLPPFSFFDLVNLFVARPVPTAKPDAGGRSVSVVVPARNEQGNIAQILQRMPAMGTATEVIFVEGNSSDDTYAEIQRQIEARPGKALRLFKQPGRGKADAVRLGFEQATGDILMILDADLSVAPEDLALFFDVIASGKGEFINGVRLVYPMEGQAMRFINLIGNKCYSFALSWLLGQTIKDTLCGTKVIARNDYQRLAANRAYFGDFDPFGDFDLIMGAAKLNLRIVDLPIRYHARTYGTTNIQRWRHGLMLLWMIVHAARRLKLV